jgi:undecaprenyl pyrophosphate phosphatase UppP
MKRKHKVMLSTIGVCVAIIVISILGYHYPKPMIKAFLGMIATIIAAVIVTIIYFIIDDNFFQEDNSLESKGNDSENS